MADHARDARSLASRAEAERHEVADPLRARALNPTRLRRRIRSALTESLRHYAAEKKDPEENTTLTAYVTVPALSYRPAT